MSKIDLEPLTVRLHEPVSNLLERAVESQKWQVEYIKDSKSFTRPSKIKSLSREIKEKESKIKKLEKEFDVLKQWRIQLNPYVDPLELISLYQKSKKSIPADIDQWAKSFGFYELTFGGGIFVERGMRVRKLEIGIVFDPELKEEEIRSTAYSIFPRNEWKKYGKISVVFGVSGDLGFHVPLTPQGFPYGKIGELAPQMKAEFLLGPFIYAFRRAVIRGVGKGHYIVNWVIEKGDILNGGDFETRVVLKVPKTRHLVKAKVALQATVIPPGFWKHVLGKARTMAPDIRTYNIKLV